MHPMTFTAGAHRHTPLRVHAAQRNTISPVSKVAAAICVAAHENEICSGGLAVGPVDRMSVIVVLLWHLTHPISVKAACVNLHACRPAGTCMSSTQQARSHWGPKRPPSLLVADNRHGTRHTTRILLLCARQAVSCNNLKTSFARQRRSHVKNSAP